MEPAPDVAARVDSVEKKLDGLIETVDQRFEAVDRRFEAVDRRLEAVDRRFDRVEGRLDRLEIVMEDIRDQVRLIAEGHAATQALIERKSDELMARLDLRVEPLERAVRHHSLVLEHHNLTAGPGSA